MGKTEDAIPALPGERSNVSLRNKGMKLWNTMRMFMHMMLKQMSQNLGLCKKFNKASPTVESSRW